MQRHERIESDFKNSIYDVITNKVKNPNIKGLITVSDVKITKDLKYATIYISVFGTSKKNIIETLNKSNKFIRGEVSRRVKMRNTPELIFKLDDSIEYGAYMNKVIEDLKKGE